MLDQFLFEYFVNFEKSWIGKDYNTNGINVCFKCYSKLWTFVEISGVVLEIEESFRKRKRSLSYKYF